MNNISYTKEAIASRMFRNAARQWGLSDTNMDNFDPIVKLLVEACAVEIYKLNNQVETVQERMIEKLANILTPQVYTLPKPAHGVLHSRSVDPDSLMSKTMQFFYQKKVASKFNGPLDSNIELFFSPVGRSKLIDGDVKLIATGQNVFATNDNFFQKDALMRLSRPLPYRCVWVGLDVHDSVEDLTSVSFFFDLKNTADRERYINLFPFTQCSANGTPVHLSKGLADLSAMPDAYQFQNSLEELYINARIEHQVNNFYKNQFLTITQDNPYLKTINKNIKQKYPVEFEDGFSSRELAQFNKDLLWFKFTFHPEFTPDVLDDLTISVNSFPVANRRLNEVTYKLQSFFNIIPLSSTEQFLAVDKVESTADNAKGDKQYKFYPFDQFDNNYKGIFTVRYGDLERFDARNATEYMNYMLELLRDESRAFAAMGQDFIASQIKLLNQNISLIEQRLKQNADVMKNSPAYILINPLADNDTIFAQFWSSNGTVGNNVRSGSKLELYEGAALKKESIWLVTTTAGGTDKLKNTETLPAYKNVLISRGRIVTREDIKSYCAYFLTGKAAVENIEIGKGVAVSSKPAEGLIPTVDIKIKPAKSDVLEAEEWNVLKYELLTNLETLSAVNLNYRVFVN